MAGLPVGGQRAIADDGFDSTSASSVGSPNSAVDLRRALSTRAGSLRLLGAYIDGKSGSSQVWRMAASFHGFRVSLTGGSIL